MDKNKMRWLGLGFVAALTLVLIFQNTQVVVARLLLWQFELSLALLVFLVALVLSVGGGSLGCNDPKPPRDKAAAKKKADKGKKKAKSTKKRSKVEADV